jgi:hypothetical protein
MLTSSSGEALAIFFPIFLIDSVRTWLILAQGFLGSFVSESSRVRGYPARWGWLVIATAMTVPDRSLKMLWLKIRTGRKPPCSLPMTGFKSAQ